jgi:hypothetical protein
MIYTQYPHAPLCPGPAPQHSSPPQLAAIEMLLDEVRRYWMRCDARVACSWCAPCADAGARGTGQLDGVPGRVDGHRLQHAAGEGGVCRWAT